MKKFVFVLFVYLFCFDSSAPAQMSFLPGSSYSECGAADSMIFPDAANCNGASVTSIVFNNASRTVVSGTDNTTGVVYRYSNAGTAPDGTVLDALVTVQSYSNNQDNDQTNFPSADLLGTSAGFDQNLQPSIGQTNNFIVAAPWSGSITYRIQFVVTGTTTPKVISVAATTIDNDGSSACGGLREAVTYSTALNQVLTTASTAQVLSGNTITAGSGTVQTGIGVGADFANAALYVNVSELTWTYSFSTSGNCTVGNAPEVRYGSLNMNCQVTNFGRTFASVSLSGRVFNDVNGTTGGVADQTGTNAGGTLRANLIDANNFVVSSVAVAADGTYTFPNALQGSYTVQLSTNQGVESSLAPVKALPANWVNTGENLGAGTGNDGNANGLLSVTVNAASITNANFGIQQRPVANNGMASSTANPGGTNNVTVPASTFTAADTAPGTVSSLRISGFPTNATTITINGTQYNSGSFPGGGVIIPANVSGNPTQTITVDPVDGAVTVGIPFMAIDNGGFESASSATASAPLTLAPTSASASISGTLYFQGNPLPNALVTLIDTATGSKVFVRTDASGNYAFENKEVGKTYIVQPLSGKYSFSPATNVLSLTADATEQNFNSTAKRYHPKNDFDGDGKSDVVVFRPSSGTWYVLKSSDDRMSAFQFGLSTDIPVSGDFDGDGKTDFAVFRPSEGNWYVWQSETQRLRVEQFGLADDTLVPADYDGDGRTDIAVYRNGVWYIRRSSDNSFETKTFGLNSDKPIPEDFDGDGKADFAVYRPLEGVWYLSPSAGNSSAVVFGSVADVPAASDFDGDGRADVAQFRNGYWFVLNSTTDFEVIRFGSDEDRSIVGDYDGDGRADAAFYRAGLWAIRNSGSGIAKEVYFGLPDDILVK